MSLQRKPCTPERLQPKYRVGSQQRRVAANPIYVVPAPRLTQSNAPLYPPGLPHPKEMKRQQQPKPSGEVLYQTRKSSVDQTNQQTARVVKPVTSSDSQQVLAPVPKDASKAEWLNANDSQREPNVGPPVPGSPFTESRSTTASSQNADDSANASSAPASVPPPSRYADRSNNLPPPPPPKRRVYRFPLRNLGLEALPPIDFCSPNGPRGYGVNLEDLYYGRFSLMDADRQLFAEFQGSESRIALHWPGYPATAQSHKFATIDPQSGRHFTRATFGRWLASIIKGFMDSTASGTSNNIKLMPECQDYKIKPQTSFLGSDERGIRVCDVWIHSVRFYGGVWVPELLFEMDAREEWEEEQAV